MPVGPLSYLSHDPMILIGTVGSRNQFSVQSNVLKNTAPIIWFLYLILDQFARLLHGRMAKVLLRRLEGGTTYSL
jgi:hypothetical protein